MDIIIPLGTGSTCSNIELKYALRGIEKFAPHTGQVFIIGEKPGFLQNVVHIRCHDQPGAQRKESNIFRKIMEAVYDDRVSDDFQFWNDDHFLLQPWHGQYYFYGLMETKLAQKRLTEKYRITVANTIRVADGLWWDIHCPIIYNKTKFADTVGKLKWNMPWGYAIKSCYCNLNGITGTSVSDMKLGKPDTIEQLREKMQHRLFFSTGKQLHPSMLQYLAELYPNKSKYEK